MPDEIQSQAASSAARGMRQETTEKRLLAELRAVRTRVEHLSDTLRSLAGWQERRKGRADG